MRPDPRQILLFHRLRRLLEATPEALRFAASYGVACVRDRSKARPAADSGETFGASGGDRTELLRLQRRYEDRGQRDDVVSFYDELAPRYDELVPPAWRARFEAADDFIVDAIGPVGTVLELGVGTGRLLARVKAEARIGLDLSLAMCRAATEREIEVVRGDQAAVPFREGLADAVVSGHASGRYTPLPDFLGQIAFALRDGGKFGVHLFTGRTLRLRSVLRPWKGEPLWSAPPPPATCHNLPPWPETRELFEHAGLKIERWMIYRNLPREPYLIRLPSATLFDLASEAVLVGSRMRR